LIYRVFLFMVFLDLLWLKAIFTDARNRHSISVILKQVGIYDRLVKEQAEKIDQEELDGKKWKCLKNWSQK